MLYIRLSPNHPGLFPALTFLLALIALSLPLPSWAETAPNESETVVDYPRIALGGLIQGRYSYQYLPGEHQDEMSLRRAWLDVRGELAHDTSLRLQLDTSNGDVAVRDAWLNYRLNDIWQVRLGQFVVPFGLPRDIGSPNRLFTELSLAGNAFEVPQGRDVGVSAMARQADNRWSLAMGVFDGRGRVDRRDESRPATQGRLASMRGAFALVGELPSHAGTEGRRNTTTFAIGAGVQGANRNYLRNCCLGLAEDTEQRRADWASGTVDLVARHGASAFSAAVFHRHVSPDHFRSYNDRGLEVSLARALPWKGLEAVARHSFVHRDTDNRLDEGAELAGRDKEWSAGLNIHHDGHRHKTQLIASSRDSDKAHWEAQLQHQVRF